MNRVLSKHLAFFVFLALIFNADHVFADGNPINKMVSFQCQNMKVEQVLNNLSLESDIAFSYNSDKIPTDSLVSLNVKNSSVKSVLNSILPTEDYQYKVVSRTIVILPKKHNSGPKGKKQKYQISGIVIDRKTGNKISQATVFDIKKFKSAMTDQNGGYELSVASKEQKIQLAISKKGYYDTVIFVRPSQEQVKVKLKPLPGPVNAVEERDARQLLQEDEIMQMRIVKAVTPKEIETQQENLRGVFLPRVGQVSFLPMLGTNRRIGLSTNNNLSFNVLGGYSSSTQGLEVGGLVNIVRKDMEGIQIGGFSNIVGNEVRGLQIGGFSNHCKGKVKGIQIGGFGNWVSDTVKGIQLAGFSNVVKGKVNGFQVAGFSNHSKHRVDGGQFAGFMNIARDYAGHFQVAGFFNYGENLEGTQMGGFLNISKKPMKGFQVAGFMNISEGVDGHQLAGFMNLNKGDVEGSQISGFLNTAKKVKGVQFSFINIADSVDGAAIGIFSFVKHGYHKFELVNNELSTAELRFKTGTEKFHNILYVGSSFVGPQITWNYGYGFGTFHHLWKDKIYGNVDLTAGVLNPSSGFNQFFNLHSRLAANLNVKLGSKFYLFGGPSINWLIYDNLNPWIETNTPSNPVSITATRSTKTWVGYNLGVRF